MKDENGREYSEYDIDKLIEEYSHINRNDEPEQASQPPREKKKFVVHIDESLIDDSPQNEEPKPQSGGIYFKLSQTPQVTRFAGETRCRA